MEKGFNPFGASGEKSMWLIRHFLFVMEEGILIGFSKDFNKKSTRKQCVPSEGGCF